LLCYKVCEECNWSINNRAENKIIDKLHSIRLLVNPQKRHNKDENIPHKYKITYADGEIKAESNAIKAQSEEDILGKCIYQRNDETGEAYKIGPIDSIRDEALKRGVSYKEISTENISLEELYPISLDTFFSDEMKTMVAKICFEWAVSKFNSSLNYDSIRDSLYNNRVDESNLVDILTDIDVADNLFENIYKHPGRKIIRQSKFLVGDYVLFYAIKDRCLYCFFVFLGMIIYKVFISKIIPEEYETSQIDIHVYPATTGILEKYHLNIYYSLGLKSLVFNGLYNNTKGYMEYLGCKYGELVHRLRPAPLNQENKHKK